METITSHSPLAIPHLHGRWTNWRHFRRDPLGFMAELRAASGTELVPVTIGPREFYIGYHPSIAREVLKDSADSFRKSRYIFDRMGPLIGKRALVRLEGERWAQNRKLTMQFFSPTRFDEFLDSVDWALERMFVRLETAAETGVPIEINRWVTELVLLAAGKMLFNMDLKGSLSELHDAFLEMNRFCGQGIRGVFRAPDWLPTARHRGLWKEAARLHRLILQEFSKCKNPESLEEHIVAFFRGNRNLRENPHKTVGQMIAFLFPAFETTSTSICWTMQLVAKHADAQRRVREEIGTAARPAVRDFGKWSYTEAVYKESLRLYPPAWILAREPIQKFNLQGTELPPDATVFLNLREIHRHPDFWTNPNQFDPDRFLDSGEPKDPFAYIPFGAGPRICSGNNLGLTEGMWILASCLKRYDFTLVNDISPIEPWITSRPKSETHVKVSKR